jgi:hypothetical protein
MCYKLHNQRDEDDSWRAYRMHAVAYETSKGPFSWQLKDVELL